MTCMSPSSRCSPALLISLPFWLKTLFSPQDHKQTGQCCPVMPFASPNLTSTILQALCRLDWVPLALPRLSTSFSLVSHHWERYGWLSASLSPISLPNHPPLSITKTDQQSWSWRSQGASRTSPTLSPTRQSKVFPKILQRGRLTPISRLSASQSNTHTYHCCTPHTLTSQPLPSPCH